MATKRSIQERMTDLEQHQQDCLDKAKQYAAQLKKLKQEQKKEERNKRTRLLIRMGGVAESILQRPLEEDDIDRFLHFLNQQEQRGGYFTKAMAIPEPENTDIATTLIPLEADNDRV